MKYVHSFVVSILLALAVWSALEWAIRSDDREREETALEYGPQADE